MNNWGKYGEGKAKQYLINNGYKILNTNYTSNIGEVDIIAKKDKTIIFVEVKYRNNTEFGYPRESVTTYKQNKIRKVSLLYLKQYHMYDVDCRFDVIEILGDKLTHIPNAF